MYFQFRSDYFQENHYFFFLLRKQYHLKDFIFLNVFSCLFNLFSLSHPTFLVYPGFLPGCLKYIQLSLLFIPPALLQFFLLIMCYTLPIDDTSWNWGLQVCKMSEVLKSYPALPFSSWYFIHYSNYLVLDWAIVSFSNCRWCFPCR